MDKKANKEKKGARNRLFVAVGQGASPSSPLFANYDQAMRSHISTLTHCFYNAYSRDHGAAAITRGRRPYNKKKKAFCVNFKDLPLTPTPGGS